MKNKVAHLSDVQQIWNCHVIINKCCTGRYNFCNSNFNRFSILILPILYFSLRLRFFHSVTNSILCNMIQLTVESKNNRPFILTLIFNHSLDTILTIRTLLQQNFRKKNVNADCSFFLFCKKNRELHAESYFVTEHL